MRGNVPPYLTAACSVSVTGTKHFIHSFLWFTQYTGRAWGIPNKACAPHLEDNEAHRHRSFRPLHAGVLKLSHSAKALNTLSRHKRWGTERQYSLQTPVFGRRFLGTGEAILE